MTPIIILATLLFVSLVLLLLLATIRAISKGSPKSFEQCEHHGARVWVRSRLRGKHRDHCLCHSCTQFHPGAASNCDLAQGLYKLCVKNHMVTPVWECPRFKQDLID